MSIAHARRLWPAWLAVLGLTGVIYAAVEPDQAPARAAMVVALRRQGIQDQRVLTAMSRVPRHLFVPEAHKARAYADVEIPIGGGKVMCSPYLVALMTQGLKLKPKARVLEIGTGSGYNTAVLAELAGEVYTLDRQRPLLDSAAARLRGLGYRNVRFGVGEEAQGWSAAGPYDAILLTSAVDAPPLALERQLADGGCLVCPVGRGPEQTLERLQRSGTHYKLEVIVPVRTSASMNRPPRPR